MSRQQQLTQQTSTNASQDIERQSYLESEENNYQLSKQNQKQEVANSKVNRISTNMISKKQSSSSTSYDPQFYEFTEVFVWGDDRWGQLGLYHQKQKKGNQDQTSFKLPKTCSFNILIKQISCGENHSAILTNQGHLYMMGCNSEGQLGIGDNCPDLHYRDSAGAPCLVDKLRDYKVQSVECGTNFTFAIANEKMQNSEFNKQHIFAWGSNREGQLGISSHTAIDLPTKVNFFEPENIFIKQISAGLSHSLFLTQDSKVFATGSNSSGQLGIGENFKQAIQPMMIDELIQFDIDQIAAGNHHSLFLTHNGEVYSCGNNQLNQLGIQEVQINSFIPIKIQTLSHYKIVKISAQQESSAISNQGELFLWGKGVFGNYRTPQKILTISNPVVDVSLGGTQGTALDNKGLLWTWGTNEYGELGVGDNDPRVHPYPILTLKGKKVTQIQCGQQFVIALGVNIKKEIPQLKLKNQKKNSISEIHNHPKKNNLLTQIQNSQEKSASKLNKSKSKKRNKNNSSSKALKRDSVGKITKMSQYNDFAGLSSAGVQ